MAEAVLLHRQQLQWHQSGSVSLDQAQLFSLYVADTVFVFGRFVFGDGFHGVHALAKVSFDRQLSLLGELDGGVVRLNEILDLMRRYPRQRAAFRRRVLRVWLATRPTLGLLKKARTGVLTTDAVEVVVDASVTVLGAGEDQALTATTAEQAALEVVVMQAALVTTGAVSGYDSLNLLKQLRLDDGLVSAFVLDSFVGDDADVVRIFEDAVDLAGRQRLTVVFLGWSGAQALGVKHLTQ